MPLMSTKPIDPLRASPAAAPLIFSPKRIALNHKRAARRRARQSQPQFLLARMAEDIAERLLMINRRFQNALIICPEDFETILQPFLAPDKKPAQITTCTLQVLGPTLKQGRGFDLVIIVMSHHVENDPQGLFRALKGYMVDDGHLMSVCIGGESLSQLRHSLYGADQTLFGGVTPRMHPLISLQQNVQLLASSGFNLTTGDRDRLAVQYKDFATLISDIRDLGEGYALAMTPARRVSRQYWDDVKEIYRREFSDNNRFTAHFDILWASGWTPHHSQQKPLKPGSGKVHMSDIFKPKT